MIQILPIPAGELAGLCDEKQITPPPGAELTGWTAAQGETVLGRCLAAGGEPCLILWAEAEDTALADGLLRAALHPLYEAGARRYRFAAPPPLPVPEGYATSGEGELAELFAPCGGREVQR